MRGEEGVNYNGFAAIKYKFIGRKCFKIINELSFISVVLLNFNRACKQLSVESFMAACLINNWSQSLK